MSFRKPNTGSSGVLGVATIWNTPFDGVLNYATWADLADIPSPRQSDEALVLDADGNGNFAFARYSEDLSAWALYQSQFFSLSEMEDFPHPIFPYASAIVESRIFTYGDVNSPDGSTPFFWLPQSIYDNIDTVAAILDGDEADTAARLAKGFIDNIIGSGVITGDVGGSGYTRLFCPSTSGTHRAELQTLNGVMTASTKVYMKFRVQATKGGTATTGVIGSYVADGGNLCYPRQGGTAQSYGFQNAANSIISSEALRSGGSVLPVTDTWIELVDDGRTVLATIYRDGIPYHTAKRSSVATGVNLCGLIVGAISSGANVSADFKDAIIVTYT